jgi:outer membrane immunogenic protein
MDCLMLHNKEKFGMLRALLLTILVLGWSGQAAFGAAAGGYDWSGFYVGAHAGASWGDGSARYDLGATTLKGLDPTGFTTGGHLGFNAQNDFVVIGIETDASWRNASARDSFGFPGGDLAFFRVEQNWFGTLRPRFGFAIKNVLLYGTAGVAIGNAEQRYKEDRPGVASRSKSKSETSFGYAVGGGAEYGFLQRFSFGLEYLFLDLGDDTLSKPAETINGLSFPATSAKFDNRSHIGRLRLTYKF